MSKVVWKTLDGNDTNVDVFDDGGVCELPICYNSFDCWLDPSEDIYTKDDGEPLDKE